jgi:hypothetical protein
MDIEKFTKGELISAALLISFVTAILTGAVIMFLSEDAPRDIIRVSERIISNQEATSSPAKQVGENQSEEVIEEKTRDEIIATAVAAVARITASTTPPQAGVLLRVNNNLSVITTSADFSSGAEALFQDGVVAELGKPTNLVVGDLTQLPIQQASGPIRPLQVSETKPIIEDSLFVVPLSEFPQIELITVTAISGDLITTTASALPAGSLLFDRFGAVLGMYEPESDAFRSIFAFTAH